MVKQTIEPGDLLVNDYPVATRSETLEKGQVLSRGAVLGRITTTRKLKLSDATATDGSQVPVCVLAIDADATDDDEAVVAYHSAGLDASKLIFGGGHDAATVEAAFCDAGLSLYIKHLN